MSLRSLKGTVVPPNLHKCHLKERPFDGMMEANFTMISTHVPKQFKSSRSYLDQIMRAKFPVLLAKEMCYHE